MLPRVFIDAMGAPVADLVIRGEDGRHFAKSLRVKPGEQLVAAMINGPWLGDIVDVSGNDVRVRLNRPWPSSEPSAKVILVQSLAKGDKMESILQKCTEVGVSGFVAYEAERSVSRIGAKVDSKLMRWQKVIRESAMQSQRDAIPEIAYEDDLPRVCSALLASGVHHLLVLDETERATGIKTALRGLTDEGSPHVALFVGPEGGIGERERQQLQKFALATTVTLGPRVLRTETAGAVAAAIILAEYNDMGG